MCQDGHITTHKLAALIAPWRRQRQSQWWTRASSSSRRCFQITSSEANTAVMNHALPFNVSEVFLGLDLGVQHSSVVRRTSLTVNSDKEGPAFEAGAQRLCMVANGVGTSGFCSYELGCTRCVRRPLNRLCSHSPRIDETLINFSIFIGSLFLVSIVRPIFPAFFASCSVKTLTFGEGPGRSELYTSIYINDTCCSTKCTLANTCRTINISYKLIRVPSSPRRVHMSAHYASFTFNLTPDAWNSGISLFQSKLKNMKYKYGKCSA